MPCALHTRAKAFPQEGRAHCWRLTWACMCSWEDAWHPEKGDVHFYDMAPDRDAWNPGRAPASC